MPDPYPAVELRRQRVLLAQTMTTRCLEPPRFDERIPVANLHSQPADSAPSVPGVWIKSLASHWPGTVCARTLPRLALRVHRNSRCGSKTQSAGGQKTMLTNKRLKDFVIHATDGELGSVTQLLFSTTRHGPSATSWWIPAAGLEAGKC